MSYSFTFGHNAIQHKDGVTSTTLPDGSTLVAIPQHDDSYYATAHRLGYGDDVDRLNRDHDLVHCLLAHWLDLPSSPALNAAKAGDPINDLTGAEEDAVMAIQRFANLLGINLTTITKVK